MKSIIKYIFLSLFIFSCTASHLQSKFDKKYPYLKTISKDSLYIEENANWQPVDSMYVRSGYETDVKFCTLTCVKIDKNTLLYFTASVVKTKKDSLVFFVPPDYGGTLVAGKPINGTIESRAKSFQGKKFTWLSSTSFRLGNKVFIKEDKTDLDFLKFVISNLCFSRGADSLEIVLGGP